MPTVSQFPQQTENKGGDVSNGRSTIVVVGFVIILVALYLAVLFYCQFRQQNDDPAPSLSSSLLTPAYPPPLPSLPLIILIYSQSRDPLQQGLRTHLPNRSATIRPADLAPVNHVFIYNDYSNTPFAGANLNGVNLSYQSGGTSGGDVG